MTPYHLGPIAFISFGFVWLAIGRISSADELTRGISPEHLASIHESCPGTREEGLRYFDVRLSRTRIPRQKTQYICQQFAIPQATEYHAVAFQPLINNTDVMHHMLLFGCAYNTKASTVAHSCGSYDATFCSSWLTVWTVGLKEQITCMHPMAGFKFGRDVVNTMALQIHWANTKLEENSFDNSGIRVWYVEKLRPYDVGNVQIGQDSLVIPPQRSLTLQEGSCSGHCTRSRLVHPIRLTRTYLHMHHLGVRASLCHYRREKLLRRIADDKDYQFERPEIHYHTREVRVLPGDELRVSCWYDSLKGDKSRNETIYFGEGSHAEMCYAFVSYYPRIDGLDHCTQMGKRDTCDSDGVLKGCDVMAFVRNATFNLFPNVLKQCTENTTCTLTTCRAAIEQVLQSACMKGDNSVLVRNTYVSKLEMWPRVATLLTSYNRCAATPQTLTFH